MAELFAIFGVVFIVGIFMALVPLGLGYFTDKYDYGIPAFIWCVMISSAIISFFVVRFVLGIGQ